jgi:hypothetical protein
MAYPMPVGSAKQMLACWKRSVQTQSKITCPGPQGLFEVSQATAQDLHRLIRT